MFIKVDGDWHQANEAETATLCGLDPDEADDYRSTLPEGAALHDGCARAGETQEVGAGDVADLGAPGTIPDAEPGSHLLDEPKPGGDMWPGPGGYTKPE